MRASVRLSLLLVVAVVGALTPATVAQADWSPVTTPFTATARDFSLTYSGITINCTNATIADVTPAVTFSVIIAPLTLSGCGTMFTRVTPTCSGTVSLPIHYYTAVTGQAEGWMDLDANFNCTFVMQPVGCSITATGRRDRMGYFYFRNSTQVLQFRFIDVPMTDTGSACSGNTGGGTRQGLGNARATFAVTPRLTVS